jgi:hypothetical protein
MGYADLSAATRQYAAFFGLHSYLAGPAILASSYLDTDLSTGQQAQAPPGEAGARDAWGGDAARVRVSGFPSKSLLCSLPDPTATLA